MHVRSMVCVVLPCIPYKMGTTEMYTNVLGDRVKNFRKKQWEENNSYSDETNNHDFRKFWANLETFISQKKEFFHPRKFIPEKFTKSAIHEDSH